jgi:putative transcriptional regulator
MRHLPNETLVEHASGQHDLAARVLVEAHLDLCPACRDEHAELALPGGRLLAETAPALPPHELWTKIEAGLPPAGDDGLPAELPLPLAARAELALRPAAEGGLRWWRLGLGGARMTQLAHDASTGVRLLVGHMPPGLRFPRHVHLGLEQVVVLSGGYDDERGEFVAGDYGVYEPGSEHGPETLDGDDCWILFRLDGPVRFRGWRGLLQRLMG